MSYPDFFRHQIPNVAIDALPTVCFEVNTLWAGHVRGAIESILIDSGDAYWDGDEDEILDAQRQVMKLLVGVVCMPIGSVLPYAGNVASLPDGFVLCDGATYTEVDYTDAYSVWNTAFKDTMNETFTVPDLRARFVFGASGSYNVGDSGGSETHTLTIDEMPAHSHVYTQAVTTVINGGLEAPANSATPSVANTSSVGGGQAHNNMPPFLVLSYIVRLL